MVHKSRLREELDAVVWPGLSGVVISRLESAREVSACDEMLTRLESERGFQANNLRIVASMETALGNHHAMEIIKASPRVWGATVGRADLEMDLRPEPSGELHLFPYLMERLVIIACAAGVTPLGAWWRPPARGLQAGAEDTYEAALRGKALGFKGALCVEGHQVEPVNRGFNHA
jgi:citrate lyase subunit beta/citryl-CoA lyase